MDSLPTIFTDFALFKAEYCTNGNIPSGSVPFRFNEQYAISIKRRCYQAVNVSSTPLAVYAAMLSLPLNPLNIRGSSDKTTEIMMHQYMTFIHRTIAKAAIDAPQDADPLNLIDSLLGYEVMLYSNIKAKTTQPFADKIYEAVNLRMEDRLVKYTSNDYQKNVNELIFADFMACLEYIAYRQSIIRARRKAAKAPICRSISVVAERANLAPAKAKQAPTAFGHMHALVQRTKFKYEYIVGDAETVNDKIGSDEIIFAIELKQINPDYLSIIHDSLKSITANEPKRAITYEGHFITVRAKAKTTIAEIARIYRTAH